MQCAFGRVTANAVAVSTLAAPPLRKGNASVNGNYDGISSHLGMSLGLSSVIASSCQVIVGIDGGGFGKRGREKGDMKEEAEREIGRRRGESRGKERKGKEDNNK